MKDTRVLPVRKKRRSRQSLPARLRTYWIVSTIAIVLAVWGTTSLMRWSGFHPKSVEVVGVSRVPEAEIRRAARVDLNANMWLADVRAIERRVEAIPYVATAHVHRRLPGSLTIDVTERAPEACVRFAGGAADDEVTIDSARRVLELGCEDAPRFTYSIKGAPMLPGRTLASSDLQILQGDRAALAALGRTFESLSLDRFGGLDATLADGIAVRFGDDLDLDRKERLIGPVLAAVSNRINLVAAVDVRAPTAPVVDFR